MSMLLVLSLGGLVFSGYMSGIRLFTHTCALGERCPTVFGYPACYFGFSMFLAMTALLGAAEWGTYDADAARWWITCIALAGILFSGYFALSEIRTLFTRGFGTFMLILPTCAWGLLFYIAIFAIAFVQKTGTTI